MTFSTRTQRFALMVSVSLMLVTEARAQEPQDRTPDGPRPRPGISSSTSEAPLPRAASLMPQFAFVPQQPGAAGASVVIIINPPTAPTVFTTGFGSQPQALAELMARITAADAVGTQGQETSRAERREVTAKLDSIAASLAQILKHQEVLEKRITEIESRIRPLEKKPNTPN